MGLDIGIRFDVGYLEPLFPPRLEVLNNGVDTVEHGLQTGPIRKAQVPGQRLGILSSGRSFPKASHSGYPRIRSLFHGEKQGVVVGLGLRFAFCLGSSPGVPCLLRVHCNRPPGEYDGFSRHLFGLFQFVGRLFPVRLRDVWHFMVNGRKTSTRRVEVVLQRAHWSGLTGAAWLWHCEFIRPTTVHTSPPLGHLGRGRRESALAPSRRSPCPGLLSGADLVHTQAESKDEANIGPC